MPTTQPDGYLALPATGKGSPVLVLHAWWGLNETIKAFCRRLAEAGFVAFAPDLYHGKVAKTIAEAEILGGTVDANYIQAKIEVVEAARFLLEYTSHDYRGLAVVAFSLGAYFALALADAEPDYIHSVVLFYGTDGTVGGDYSRSRASYLGHFAEMDVYESQSNIDHLAMVLRQAGRPVDFHLYPGTGHWFFEPDRVQAYHPEAANLAWQRTLDFLKRASSM